MHGIALQLEKARKKRNEHQNARVEKVAAVSEPAPPAPTAPLVSVVALERPVVSATEDAPVRGRGRVRRAARAVGYALLLASGLFGAFGVGAVAMGIGPRMVLIEKDYSMLIEQCKEYDEINVKGKGCVR